MNMLKAKLNQPTLSQLKKTLPILTDIHNKAYIHFASEEGMCITIPSVVVLGLSHLIFDQFICRQSKSISLDLVRFNNIIESATDTETVTIYVGGYLNILTYRSHRKIYFDFIDQHGMGNRRTEEMEFKVLSEYHRPGEFVTGYHTSFGIPRVKFNWVLSQLGVHEDEEDSEFIFMTLTNEEIKIYTDSREIKLLKENGDYEYYTSEATGESNTEELFMHHPCAILKATQLTQEVQIHKSDDDGTSLNFKIRELGNLMISIFKDEGLTNDHDNTE